jgi:hypothetical protein
MIAGDGEVICVSGLSPTRWRRGSATERPDDIEMTYQPGSSEIWNYGSGHRLGLRRLLGIDARSTQLSRPGAAGQPFGVSW